MPRKPRSNPRIFLSYNRTDSEFGIDLVKRLRWTMGEEEAVWFDNGLRGGENWWDRIKKQLKSSNVFIVVLSPDAVKSKWVKQEINIAWWRYVHKKMRIIPVLYRECKVPEDLNTLHIISVTSSDDYEVSFQRLVEALKLPQSVNVSAHTSVLENTRIDHIQQMTQHMEEAFGNEDWHYIIAMAKALIQMYSGDVPAIIYQMQGFAYIYADRVYPDQYTLAQEAITAALVRVDDRELRLVLLDVNGFIFVSRSQWKELLACANEALQLASDSHMWQAVQEEAFTRSGQNGLVGTSHDQDEISIVEIKPSEAEIQQYGSETQTVCIDKEHEKGEFELERQHVEVQKARFELEKDRMTFALEIGDVIAEKLYPGTDVEEKATLLRTLFPQLLQLGSSKAVELVLPPPEIIQQKTGRELELGSS